MTTAKRPPSDPPGAARPSGIRPTFDPEHLFRAALPTILKMAEKRGFHDAEQWDIAQAVGEMLVRCRDEYDPHRGTPIEWAIGIAKNLIREAARRQRTERRYIDAAPNEAVENRPALDLTPEERALAKNALSLVRATLTDEQYEVFELVAECTRPRRSPIWAWPACAWSSGSAKRANGSPRCSRRLGEDKGERAWRAGRRGVAVRDRGGGRGGSPAGRGGEDLPMSLGGARWSALAAKRRAEAGTTA